MHFGLSVQTFERSIISFIMLVSYSTSHHDSTNSVDEEVYINARRCESLSQWTEEVKAEFAPLFLSCFGKKGSLSETMIAVSKLYLQ